MANGVSKISILRFCVRLRKVLLSRKRLLTFTLLLYTNFLRSVFYIKILQIVDQTKLMTKKIISLQSRNLVIIAVVFTKSILGFIFLGAKSP